MHDAMLKSLTGAKDLSAMTSLPPT